MGVSSPVLKKSFGINLSKRENRKFPTTSLINLIGNPACKCVHLRTDEHEDVKKGSDPAKHLKENVGHISSWKLIANASA